MRVKESKGTNDARAKKDAASREIARAKSDALFASIDARAAEHFFAKRGFSSETIKDLVAHGILMPEELLFMSGDNIVGISFDSAKISLAEIRAYRQRFLLQDK